MARTSFEKLRVYQLSEEIADFTWDAVEKWDPLARETVGMHFIKAADSIGACIAGGAGRGSVRENRQFARIARGFLFEFKHWLRRARRRGLLAEEEIAMFKKLLDELTPKLSAYINAIGRKSKTNGNPQYTTH
jgi:four helix bundle protein